MLVTMSLRPIYEIAGEIRAHWERIDTAAAGYLAAMEKLNNISDDYGQDTAKEVVIRFLSVANTWHGETARRIKAELNDMLKA